MIRYAVLHPSGILTVETIEPTGVSDDTTLRRLQSEVDGYIDQLPFLRRDDKAALVNEEGIPLGLAPNPLSWLMVRHLSHDWPWGGWTRLDPLRGPVVLIGRQRADLVSLTDDQIAEIAEVYNPVAPAGYQLDPKEWTG